MFKYLLVICLASTCFAKLGYGGFVSRNINEASSNKAFDILSVANDGTNSFIKDLINARPTLVFYATQLVAGLNHAMIYKTQGMQGSFACIKIFEAIGGGYSVSSSAFGESIPEAAAACKIPIA